MFNNVKTTNLPHRLLLVIIMFLLAMTHVQEANASAASELRSRRKRIEVNRQQLRDKQEMRERAERRARERAKRRARELVKKGVYKAVYDPRSEKVEITIYKSGLGLPKEVVKEVVKAAVKRWPEVKKFIVGSAVWDVSKTVIQKYGKGIVYFSIRQTRALSNKVVDSTIEAKIQFNIPLTEFEKLRRKHRHRQAKLRRINEARKRNGLPPIKRDEQTIRIEGTHVRFQQCKGGKFIE